MMFPIKNFSVNWVDGMKISKNHFLASDKHFHDQIRDIAVLLKKHKIDGVIATNTTISRDAVKGMQHENEAGGLSGRPVFDASNKVISELRKLLPKPYPIIGVGGIASGAHALAKIEAGADLVQIYTGLIYEGPGLVGQCARAIKRGFSGR